MKANFAPLGKVTDLSVGAVSVLLGGAPKGIELRLHPSRRDGTALGVVGIGDRSVIGHVAMPS